MRSSDANDISLVHLADYGGVYPGSFIPMVRSVLQLAGERGWTHQAVFSPVAAERPWLSELREQGLTCTVAPAGHGARRELVERLCSQTRGPVILHSHFTAFDLLAAAAARRHRHVISYWHLHSALRPGPWWQARNIVKLALLSKGVEQMLCVAPNILEQASRRLAPKDRLALVPNAIELERFPPIAPERRRAARATLGLKDEEVVVLHFGWDWHRKGGDLLCHAIASLREQHLEPAGLIVLSAGAPDEALRLSQRLGIADHVRTLPPSEDVAGLYAAADLFVAPSRGEGHPFAVVEALASGLPVVASPIPGHQMIAENVSNCHLAESDAASLAKAIAHALSQPPDDRAAASKAAHQWAVTEMDIGAWSERMLARYDTALDRRPCST